MLSKSVTDYDDDESDGDARSERLQVFFFKGRIKEIKRTNINVLPDEQERKLK